MKLKIHSIHHSAAPETLQHRLDAAQQYCEKRGAKLTPLRRQVLALLMANGAAKAYKLQENMCAELGQVAPMTVYRALDFLVEHQLVHKIDATNTFMACSGEHKEHYPIMLVCGVCGGIQEWCDEHVMHDVELRLPNTFGRFSVSALEIKGACANCQTG